jgi:hypothetical protein
LALQGAIFPDGLTYHKETGFETPATSCHFNVSGFLREPELTVAGHVLSGWNTLMAQLVKIAAWSEAS